MEKLNELFALCEASVTIVHNEHKCLYQSMEYFLSERESYTDLDLDVNMRMAMVEKDQMVMIQAYPKTPIGFYVVYHWDLESAIDEMLAAVKKEKRV
jgi:hypothetical protein